MYLKNLLAAVDVVEGMPVEIDEIASHLTAVGCQDKIIFYSDAEMDPSVLRGVHYRYTVHTGAYSAPEFTTLIVYSEKLPLDWQRIVCCKELIHTCDDPVERTSTEEEVQGLLEKLLGPFSTENFGVADIMATKDKLALYQALAVLFPDAARQQALHQVQQGATAEKIAGWIVLPEALVLLVIGDNWPSLREFLINL